MFDWLILVWQAGAVAVLLLIAAHIVKIAHRAWLRWQIRKAARFPARNVVLTPEWFRKGGGL